jgi:hypothetical protein
LATTILAAPDQTDESAETSSTFKLFSDKVSYRIPSESFPTDAEHLQVLRR